MSSSYRMELDKFLAQLDVKADTVIDIGGSQLPVKGRTKSWEVGEYLIADLPEPHKDSPSPDFYIDLNNPEISWERLAAKSDLIFCLEVFDYVYDPVMAFSVIRDLLKPGGQAWVSFPFMYPTHQPIEDDALRYSEGGIRKLAASVDLKVVELIARRPETNLLDQFFRAERMRAAKGYDHRVTGWIVRLER